MAVEIKHHAPANSLKIDNTKNVWIHKKAREREKMASSYMLLVIGQLALHLSVYLVNVRYLEIRCYCRIFCLFLICC